MLTHANIAWNSVNLLLDVDLTGDEVTLGQRADVPRRRAQPDRAADAAQGRPRGPRVRVRPGRTLELIARHRVTYLFGVPTMFLAMARAPGWAEADLSSVRSAICGGAPVPEAVIATYQRTRA